VHFQCFEAFLRKSVFMFKNCKNGLSKGQILFLKKVILGRRNWGFLFWFKKISVNLSDTFQNQKWRFFYLLNLNISLGGGNFVTFWKIIILSLIVYTLYDLFEEKNPLDALFFKYIDTILISAKAQSVGKGFF
jgi:hypothetical protein